MEEDLRSSGAGLRGFKSHPRHHSKILIRGLIPGEPLQYFVLNIFLEV